MKLKEALSTEPLSVVVVNRFTGLCRRGITLLDFKSSDLAEQMTLLNNDLYQRLELPELLIWSKEQNEERFVFPKSKCAAFYLPLVWLEPDAVPVRSVSGRMQGRSGSGRMQSRSGLARDGCSPGPVWLGPDAVPVRSGSGRMQSRAGLARAVCSPGLVWLGPDAVRVRSGV